MRWRRLRAPALPYVFSLECIIVRPHGISWFSHTWEYFFTYTPIPYPPQHSPLSAAFPIFRSGRFLLLPCCCILHFGERYCGHGVGSSFHMLPFVEHFRNNVSAWCQCTGYPRKKGYTWYIFLGPLRASQLVCDECVAIISDTLLVLIALFQCALVSWTLIVGPIFCHPQLLVALTAPGSCIDALEPRSTLAFVHRDFVLLLAGVKHESPYVVLTGEKM